MLTQMAVESFEDNLFYAAWDNIAKPHVEQVLRYYPKRHKKRFS